VGLAHEDNSHAEVARRSKGAINFHVGRVVTSHSVEHDLARQLGLMLRLTSHRLALALFYLYHFATFIKAAFGANAVWHAGLTAIRAQCGLGGAQGIVRASFVATSFGVSSFRIWHNYSIKSRRKEAQKAQDVFSIIFLRFLCLLWLS
jgi:hypothetical protein